MFRIRIELALIMLIESSAWGQTTKDVWNYPIPTKTEPSSIKFFSVGYDELTTKTITLCNWVKDGKYHEIPTGDYDLVPNPGCKNSDNYTIYLPNENGNYHNPPGHWSDEGINHSDEPRKGGLLGLGPNNSTAILPISNGGTGKVEIPLCAFGLKRVGVLVIKKPSLVEKFYWGNDWTGDKALTRMACPYERAVAVFGDERVRFEAADDPRDCTQKMVGDWKKSTADCLNKQKFHNRVLVCDDAIKGTNCEEVYSEER